MELGKTIKQGLCGGKALVLVGCKVVGGRGGGGGGGEGGFEEGEGALDLAHALGEGACCCGWLLLLGGAAAAGRGKRRGHGGI